MRKLINSVLTIAMAAFLLTFTACDGKDPITPGDDPVNGDHKVLWSYDMGVGNLADIIPAIDNNDNSYYSIANQETSKVVYF